MGEKELLLSEPNSELGTSFEYPFSMISDFCVLFALFIDVDKMLKESSWVRERDRYSLGKSSISSMSVSGISTAVSGQSSDGVSSRG